jgi:F0F1-type ATP synthase membrane subunit b/b'
MGSDPKMCGKGKTVTERTPGEILDAIDKALEDAEKTAARLDSVKPKPRHYPIRSTEMATASKPKTPEEILEAIDKALEETHRRLAEAEADIEGPRGTADGS